MDRRACPSYQSFDTCDILDCVLEWSQRKEQGQAARVLRRRCRSEGVERSPFDDARSLHHTEGLPARDPHRVPNKSHFTINCDRSCGDRYLHGYLPAQYNGDFAMERDHNRYLQGFYSKSSKMNANKPSVLVSTLSNTVIEKRLPIVEELLEKVDQDMHDLPIVKQPLKSILNNPLPKSPPQGILKKPKNKVHQDMLVNRDEGRRRQRASSESDNGHLCTFHLSSPVHDRTSFPQNGVKRAKDNSGTGYSYCSALEKLSSTTRPKKSLSPPPHLHPAKVVQRVEVLRTTAINNNGHEEPKCEVEVVFKTKSPSPSPMKLVDIPPQAIDNEQPSEKVKEKRKTKTKTKRKIKAKAKSPPPNEECDSAAVQDWQMETDVLLQEIERLERKESPLNKDNPKDEPLTKVSIALQSRLTDTLPPRPPSVSSKALIKTSQAGIKLNGHAANDEKSEKLVSIAPPKSKELMAVTELQAMHSFRIGNLTKDMPLVIPESVANALRPSLFPRVPPYLKFVTHEESTPLKVPLAIQKHLKWKMTSITPIIVKKTLANSGFRLVKSECDTSECPQEETVDWVGIWGKHMKSILFRGIKDGQKMNHFPGTFQIGRKDRLWRNLQKLVLRHGEDEFGIMPQTYVLPHDLKLLKYDWEKHLNNNEKWIIKPPASARGTGIKVVSRWIQIPKKRPLVVQKYVAKPYLINGSKFDLRLYVLVTSVHPLRVYMFKDGLARFASVKYNDEVSNLTDKFMHLTNYSINKLSKFYTPNDDFEACEGHKWTLQSLFQYLKKEKKIDTNSLWETLKDVVIKTMIAGEASISSLTKANITSRYNCYELFGVDILLDENLKPWLLEVNISPSLHSASPLDIHVKGPLVSTVLNMAQFQVPVKTNLEGLTKDKPHRLNGLAYDCRLYTVYLSKEERDKHIIYTNMQDRDMYLRDILSTLTPDDVRHLIQAEDELSQCGEMERIFPTKDTHHYLNYLAGARYYNRLFDAWETRYHDQRCRGIDMLRNLCEMGYHLEVPPVPLKNDVDAPTPPASERPSVLSVEIVASKTDAADEDDARDGVVSFACASVRA